MPLGRDDFMRQLQQDFPEVIVQIDECRQGLLHCEVAVLRRLTEEAMDEGKEWLAEQHFRFVARLLQDSGPELENALEISYLEDLALGKHTLQRHRIVKERMPSSLRRRMIEIRDVWR